MLSIFRRNSTVGDKRKRGSTPEEADGSIIRDQKRLHEEQDEVVEDVGPSFEQQGRKDEEEETIRRAYLEQHDDKDNSTPQSPLGGHIHNTRMRLRQGQIQSLPDTILNRIFIEAAAGINVDGIVQVPLSKVFKKDHLALLRVCYRFRKLAVPLFYSLNSFNVRILNFDAVAIQAWWQKAEQVRGEVALTPIRIASTDSSQDLSRKPDTMEALLTGICDMDLPSDHTFPVHRLEPFTTSKLLLPYGSIRLDVHYDPHWLNLTKWLELYHAGELPAYQGQDISKVADWKPLQLIVMAFRIVEGFRACSWEDAKKSLDGIRHGLVFDSDERWQYNESQAEEVEGSEGGDEEIDNDEILKALEDAGEMEEDESSDASEDGFEEMSSPPAYRTPKETLDRHFFNTNGHPAPGSPSECPDSDSEDEESQALTPTRRPRNSSAV